MDDASLTRLALAARSGDERAAAAFIRGTAPQLRRVLRSLCDDGHEDDLTQETYLRAFGSLHRYAARSPARLWLLSIARRVAADHVRTARRSPRTTGIDTLTRPDALHHHPGHGGTVDLQQLVAGLDRERREAFVLTRVIGLSYAEAAAVCGCPLGTIRSRVFRARTDLAAALDAQDDGGDLGRGTDGAAPDAGTAAAGTR